MRERRYDDWGLMPAFNIIRLFLGFGAGGDAVASHVRIRGLRVSKLQRCQKHVPCGNESYY